jgi:hypothetical protein
VREAVRVAAPDRCHARRTRYEGGLLIVALRHRAVAGFHEREPAERQPEIGDLPLAGEPGEEVIDGGGQSFLGEEGEEGLRVSAPRLQGMVAALVEVEDVDVELAALGEAERHLLAGEEAGLADQMQGPLDRVVIGEGHEVHAPREGPLVDVARIGVAFPADVLQHGDLGAARVPGVDVQVAAHQLGTFGSTAPSFPGPPRAERAGPFAVASIAHAGGGVRVAGRETSGDTLVTSASRCRHTSSPRGHAVVAGRARAAGA